MPKEFYTERDIEDMWKRGVMSLNVTENVVLTELAYEKAQRLGMQLVRETRQPREQGALSVEPPAAPVRPYLSQASNPAVTSAEGTAESASAFGSTFGVAPASPTPPATSDLPARIRGAVTAQLGTQIDPALLDVIIQRVLKSTGVK